MLYALIYPEQKYKGGVAIVQLSGRTFDVAEPLFWKECSVDLYKGTWYYEQNTGEFIQETATIETPTTGEPPNVIE